MKRCFKSKYKEVLRMGTSEKKEKIKMFGEVFKTLRWALDILKSYRVRLYLYIVFLILQSIFRIYMTSRVGNIVDLALGDNVSGLITTGAFFVFLYFMNIIITNVGNRFSCHNYNGMYNDLELKIYRKIMDASWEKLSAYHSGDLITRLSSDVKTVAGNTSGLVPTMIADLTLLLAAGAYIIYVDYTMIFLALVIAPIVLIASRIFMGKIYDYESKIREIESQIGSYNVETFNNIQAVKAFNLGDYFYDRMLNIENTRKKVDLKTNNYIISSYATTNIAGIIGACILISWMFYRVHTGFISFGALSVIAFLALQVGRAIENLFDLLPIVMAYMASAERVKKLLEIEDEETGNNNVDLDLLLSDDDGVDIHVEDMYFKYRNGYSVFEGASFEAKPGELIALVGASGEGKTTMLRIILGIVTAYKGRTYASNSKTCIDLGLRTRPIISYVPQGNTMMAGTISENMKMVNKESSEMDIARAMEDACIYDFVQKLPGQLEYKLGQGGQGLSEGQNQRLCIARALLKDVPILLMDEATSALDITTERKILDNIRKRYPNKTIIITTHRPTVLTMCDRIYRIADKKISILNEDCIQKLIDEF